MIWSSHVILNLLSPCYHLILTLWHYSYAFYLFLSLSPFNPFLIFPLTYFSLLPFFPSPPSFSAFFPLFPILSSLCHFHLFILLSPTFFYPYFFLFSSSLHSTSTFSPSRPSALPPSPLSFSFHYFSSPLSFLLPSIRRRWFM